MQKIEFRSSKVTIDIAPVGRRRGVMPARSRRSAFILFNFAGLRGVVREHLHAPDNAFMGGGVEGG